MSKIDERARDAAIAARLQWNLQNYMDSSGINPELVEKMLEAYEAAKASEQPVELTEQVARAIAVSIYHSEGLETMNYSGEQDYANREWKHYEREAKAAVTECCRANIIDGEMLCRKCGYTARADTPRSDELCGWFVPDSCMTTLAQETFVKMMKIISRGGAVDVAARCDGKEYRWQCDGLKYAERMKK